MKKLKKLKMLAKHNRYDIVSLILLILFASFLMRFMFQDGFPQVGDAEYQLAKIGNYSKALEEGQFPPRWAPSFNYGFGYPVINFHYPLQNILGFILMRLGLNIVTSLKILVVFGFTLGGIGIYLYNRLRYSIKAALISSLIYITTPYFLHNIYNRASTGEVLAIGILPWLFLFAEKVLTSKKFFFEFLYVVTLSSFLLSHNIIALLGSIFIAGHILVSFKVNAWVRLIKPTLLSLLLVSWFWITFLDELKLVTIGEAENEAFATYFLNLKELILPVNNLDRSGSPLSIGLSSCIVWVLLFLGLHKNKSKKIYYYIVVAVLALFFTQSQSLFLWKNLSQLQLIYYPMRFLFLFSFVTTLVAASTLNGKHNSLFLGALIAAILYSATIVVTSPTNFLPYQDDFLENYPLTGTAANEYHPYWYREKEALDLVEEEVQKVFLSDSSAGTINVSTITGSYKSYILEIKTPTTVIEQTLYYPGWEVKINDKRINIDQNKNDFFGLINYKIYPGKYIVETIFTQNTTARLVGHILTILGGIIFIGGLLKNLFKTFKVNPIFS